MYTQNIDGLDYKTGIPSQKLISVHGTLGRVECENCGAPYPSEQFLAALRTNIKDIYGRDTSAPTKSNPIPCLHCGSPHVKPATVLYGRNLPREFFDNKDQDLRDLLIVLFPPYIYTTQCVRFSGGKKHVGVDLKDAACCWRRRGLPGSILHRPTSP